MLTAEQHQHPRPQTETQRAKPRLRTRATATPQELEALRREVDQLVELFFQAAEGVR